MKLPAMMLSMTLYNCWKTMLSSIGRENVMRILSGEPLVMLFMK